MNWTSEALMLIEAAPPAIQPMIRQRVESLAAEQNILEITPAFLMKARSASHAPVKPTEKNHPIDITPLLAKENVDPLTDAFEVTDDVHVFAGGTTLPRDQVDLAWNEAIRLPANADHPRCLYVHIPFCRSRCVFCPFYANRWTPGASGQYAQAILREIRQMGDSPLADLPLDAVYFGGGTPSDLAPEDFTFVMNAIRENLTLRDDAEVTAEGRVWGHGVDFIKAAVASGVNRFSIGVQTFDTPLRQSLGRRAYREQCVSFLNQLAEHGVCVVIDLIYGLPGQTLESWREDLQCLTDETHIHGVDLYRLKSVSGSAMDHLIAEGRLQEKSSLYNMAEMFAAGVSFMQNQGWERLSVSHWRRDRRERSRYNSLVKSGADCIPVGCGAGGRIGLTRFFHTGDLQTYHKAINEGRNPIASAIRLKPSSAAIDQIVAQLEQCQVIPAKWAKADSQQSIAARNLLTQWQKAGLLESESEGRWTLTPAGQFWQIQMSLRLSSLI